MWSCDQALTGEILSSYRAVGPVFVDALQALFAAQCALAGDHLWPEDATDQVVADPNYDFIIIGAGSAGSVVANRLSEIPEWKVLLVEAGGNPTLATEIPQLFYNNMNSSQDWSYITEPQNACRSYKRKGCAWPRGKVLGGCSSINGMFYIRGNQKDYEEWSSYGNEGWNYDELLPYFKKSENLDLDEPLLNKEKYHGHGGYLNVELKNDSHVLETLIIKAFNELGIKELADLNGESQMGVSKASTTTKGGIRQSTARAFLTPVKNRKNLHVMKNTLATKILFKPDSNIVDGILLTKNGKSIKVQTRKELIISAGTINTPKLLMLSGIGPKKHLLELGIELKADLPVGENLQDHLFVPIYYQIPGDQSLTELPKITAAYSQYIFERKGPFAATYPHRVTVFLNTTDSKATSPDVQYHFIVFTPNIDNLINIYHLHDLSDEFIKEFKEKNKNNLIIKIYNVLLQPKSKGRILLKSTDPRDPPLIYANYFQADEDMKTVVKSMKTALRLISTQAFKNMRFEAVWMKLNACEKYDLESDLFLECVARELTFSLYHPVGTVKMGPINDGQAVVDTELKVKSIKGLRVIDASIMPKITRGNTNAPTIMIAEKGSDLIKSAWFLRHNEL